MNGISHIFRYFIFLIFVFLVVDCQSQTKEIEQSSCINREAVVAGSFYPDNPNALKKQLESLFAQSMHIKTYDNVLAIIAPHAGYVYSGKVAASAYNQIDPDKEYENIFVIASSHRVLFKGASIYNQGDYITPLGKVKVNRNLANKLIEET